MCQITLHPTPTDYATTITHCDAYPHCAHQDLLDGERPLAAPLATAHRTPTPEPAMPPHHHDAGLPIFERDVQRDGRAWDSLVALVHGEEEDEEELVLHLGEPRAEGTFGEADVEATEELEKLLRQVLSDDAGVYSAAAAALARGRTTTPAHPGHLFTIPEEPVSGDLAELILSPPDTLFAVNPAPGLLFGRFVAGADPTLRTGHPYPSPTQIGAASPPSPGPASPDPSAGGRRISWAPLPEGHPGTPRRRGMGGRPC